jgi:hypothetical protein
MLEEIETFKLDDKIKLLILVEYIKRLHQKVTYRGM